jgi:hypothetical protein
VRRAAFIVALTALAAGATSSSAQDSDVLNVRATRRDTMTVSTTVTAAFTVRNASGDIVHVTPRVRAPDNWPVLMGTTPFAIAPNAATIVMLSVVVPARAAAGTYAVGMSVGTRTSDSIFVRVPQRRALELTLLDKPGYIVSGEPYQAHFLVRNRGNTSARVRLRARSTLGRATLTDTVARIDADGTTMVEVSVATPRGISAATDDVLELSAVQDSVADVRVASARVTVVPEPTRAIEDFLRIPTQVNLRAASSDAVSPFEVFGRGPIRDGGDTDVDFLFRGPTGPFSAFGERDEYRLSLIAPGWRVRLGDQINMLSPLTGGSQPGFGASVDGTHDLFSAGVHGQEFRRSPVKGKEIGGFVGLGDPMGLRGVVNVVRRDGGVLPGQVASAAAGYGGAPMSAHAELARSSSESGAGVGHSLRISRAAGTYSLDIGHQSADTGFSGAQRGVSQSHLTATANWFESVSLALSAGSHRSDLSRSAGVPYVDGLDIAALRANWLGQYSLELGAATRSTTISGMRQQGTQQDLRLRGDQDFGFANVAAEAEVGRARDVFAEQRVYSSFSLSVRRAIAVGQYALWMERYSGGSITRGADGTSTVGGDATLRIGRTADISLLGFATHAHVVGAPWQSQVDVMISRVIRNGNRVSLRARLIGGSSLSNSQQSVAFLEYGIPLRLPVSRLRTPGRVYGRVVDAVSGRGVPGALVRLGPQVAITDADGDVAFGGVPGGEHRLSMSQETSFAHAVFVGDPTVRVDSMRPRPTTFTLAIARGARLDIDARRFAIARTAVAGAQDSVVDAGPLSNATLVLAGERDTLYRTTRSDGKTSFTDVPPGRWVVSIRGDAPAFHRFDPDRAELTLAPGESRSLTFRLVPRKREIQIIGTDQELRSQPSDARNPAAPVPATPRTRKPDESRP